MSVYGNPLRGVQNLVPERVDQGVDYSGDGPVFALGPGVIDATYRSGWPGGGFIAERLTGGPAAGNEVYVAEDITPSVAIGDHVTAADPIGVMHGGIETGWADTGANLGYALGRSQFDGSNATAFGQSYSNLLRSLGAPAGVTSGPVAGSVPKRYALTAKAGGGFDWNPLSWPGQLGHAAAGAVGSAVGSATSGLATEAKSLAIIVPLVLAGAALIVVGAYRATNAGDKIRQVNAKGTQAAELAVAA